MRGDKLVTPVKQKGVALRKVGELLVSGLSVLWHLQQSHLVAWRGMTSCECDGGWGFKPVKAANLEANTN